MRLRFAFADYLFALLSIAAVILSCVGLKTDNRVNRVIIRVKGDDYLYSLSSPKIVRAAGLLGESVIEITDGSVRFISSPCRDRLCVQMGSADKNGNFIACLPNRVLVTVEKSSKTETNGKK